MREFELSDTFLSEKLKNGFEENRSTCLPGSKSGSKNSQCSAALTWVTSGRGYAVVLRSSVVVLDVRNWRAVELKGVDRRPPEAGARPAPPLTFWAVRCL